MDLLPPPYSKEDPSHVQPPPTNTIDIVAGSSSTTSGFYQNAVDVPESSPDTHRTLNSRPDATSRSNSTSEYDHLASLAANAFFDSRPAIDSFHGAHTTHAINVTTSTQPLELSYPAGFEAHDVHHADWLTFANFLLPHQILNEGGRAEHTQSQRDLEDAISTLDSLDVDEKGAHSQPAVLGGAQESRHKFEATISEWNRGFFHPRGIHIVLTSPSPVADVEVLHAALPDATPARVIPTWIPYDHEIIGESSSAGRRRGFFRGFQAGPHGGGFRMGPIVADNDGFRMGNLFKADQRGVRLGGSRGIVADDSGVSMGGRSIFRREVGDHDRERVNLDVPVRKATRSASVSSASSTGSLDSLKSDSSCGSLLDYDDIENHQLLTAKEAVYELLHDIDEPMTKTEVLQARAKIQQQIDEQYTQTAPETVILRREVKDLLKMFRDRKRAEKAARRMAERERQALRRAERKDRRGGKGKSVSHARESRETRTRLQKRNPGASRTDLELPIARSPPLPRQPSLNHIPSMPSGRAASVPSLNLSAQDSFILQPSPEATSSRPVHHPTWPRILPSPTGSESSSNPRLPVSPGFDTQSRYKTLFSQAHAMDGLAWTRRERAIWLRTEARSRDCSEHERAKRLRHASAVEQESQRYRLEAEMLRAEALELDPQTRNGGLHERFDTHSSHRLPIGHDRH